MNSFSSCTCFNNIFVFNHLHINFRVTCEGRSTYFVITSMLQLTQFANRYHPAIADEFLAPRSQIRLMLQWFQKQQFWTFRAVTKTITIIQPADLASNGFKQHNATQKSQTCIVPKRGWLLFPSHSVVLMDNKNLGIWLFR